MSAEVTFSPAPLAHALGYRRGDRSRLRSAALLLLVPAVLMALLWTARLGTIRPYNNDPYGPALAVAANTAVIIIGPYLALAAAWEMITLRLAWGRIPVARGWFSVVTGRLALVIGCGLVAFAACYAVIGGPVLLRHPPQPWLLLLSLVEIVAWTAFGAALSLVFRPLWSLPASLIIPFLVMSLPQGWEPFWVRHVNGYLFDCCSTGDVLDLRAVRASLGFLTVIIVCSGCVIAVRLAHDSRQARRTLAAGVMVSAVTLLSAAAVIAPVRNLGALPVQPRPIRDLTCSQEVCVWPEDVPALRANQTAWDRMSRAWSGLGLPSLSAGIAPVQMPGKLPLSTTFAQEQPAATSMAVLLPRTLAQCDQDYNDADRNNRLNAISYLLLDAIGEDPASIVPLDPGQDPPSAADAQGIWRGVKPCS